MADEPTNPLDIRLDVGKFTVGDIMDLSDESVSMLDRLKIIEKGVVQGDLRAVPINDLPQVVAQITEQLNEDSNPT